MIPKPQSEKPRLAITMGDPDGIGPEIIAGVWQEPAVAAICRPLVLGDPEVMRRALELRKIDAQVIVAEGPADVALPFQFEDAEFNNAAADRMICIPMPSAGQPDAKGGQIAYEAIELAAQQTLAGHCDGVVTAPISKAALHDAGHYYPGHTELLAELCGVRDFAMMLYLPPNAAPACPFGLGVVHVTLHTALRKVFDQLSAEAILAKCKLAYHSLRQFGAENPRIGVAALNPHAGEEGLFGEEELTLIRPAVEQAIAEGIDAAGPFPTDTLMVRARDGEFDAVVAMYHDQGHIALKLLAMHAAVNVTLGLPIVRTSVAHGTAPDLAWKGKAETAGMIAAITTAAQLADGLRK